jgi:hypothetical protein
MKANKFHRSDPLEAIPSHVTALPELSQMSQPIVSDCAPCLKNSKALIRPVPCDVLESKPSIHEEENEVISQIISEFNLFQTDRTRYLTMCIDNWKKLVPKDQNKVIEIKFLECVRADGQIYCKPYFVVWNHERSAQSETLASLKALEFTQFTTAVESIADAIKDYDVQKIKKEMEDEEEKFADKNRPTELKQRRKDAEKFMTEWLKARKPIDNTDAGELKCINVLSDEKDSKKIDKQMDEEMDEKIVENSNEKSDDDNDLDEKTITRYALAGQTIRDITDEIREKNLKALAICTTSQTTCTNIAATFVIARIWEALKETTRSIDKLKSHSEARNGTLIIPKRWIRGYNISQAPVGDRLRIFAALEHLGFCCDLNCMDRDLDRIGF